MEEANIKEFEAQRAEIAQRSSFQHAYFLLNVAGAGAVLSFSLTNEQIDPLRYQALLIVPLLSFALFMLWFHQALVISHRGAYIRYKLMPGGWEAHKFGWLTPFGARVMRWAYAVGILGSFAGIPLVSILIFLSKRAPSGWIDVTLLALAVAALVANFAAFFIWFSDFYFFRGLAVRKSDCEQADVNDE